MSRPNKSAEPDRPAGSPGPRAPGARATPQAAGVLVLDKPAGVSSARAVAVVRRRAGGVKTGHAGTLDPLATGVLVLALGRATKIIGRFMATDKRYRTVIDLSAFTTTDDAEGEPTPVPVSAPPDEAAVRSALERFRGRIMQQPPAFSAVKVGGKRAYKMARRGESARPAARPVVIHGIDLIGYDWPRLEIELHCAKGVYVRSLARDLGAALGTGGCCAMIRRTAVGPFDEQMAVALSDLPDPLQQQHLIATDTALAMLEEPG